MLNITLKKWQNKKSEVKRVKKRNFASLQVSAGNLFGMKVSALITDMNDPLGRAVGNALEVAESIQSLKNQGPEDLIELTCVLGKYNFFLLSDKSFQTDGQQTREKLQKFPLQ